MAMGIKPLGGVRDGSVVATDSAAPGEIGGAGGGAVVARVGGEVEEGAPGGGVAPAWVSTNEDGVHVRLEGETAVLGQGGVGDGAREVGLRGGRQWRGEAGDGDELRVQGEEV